jgi:Holliday junction resolvasome RuvABC endonuclease subunit
VSDSTALGSEVEIDLSRLEEFNPSIQIETEVEFESVCIPDTLMWGLDAIIVSFDQSIANTGWVVIKPDEIDGIKIVAMGLFQTQASADMMIWENNLYRSTQLFALVTDLLREHVPTLVLHETPPTGHSARMYNTESSIVTATVVSNVAALMSIPSKMVQANRVKAYLTGNRNAKKNEVRKALERRFEIQLKTPGFRKNEHTFDALGIAVTYLEDQR